MANTISILIKAQDNASGVIKDVGDSLDTASGKSKTAGQEFSNLKQHTGALVGVMAAAGAGVWALTSTIGSATDASNAYTAAMLGLSSIAGYFGASQDEAKKAAQSLANDGLMTVTEAAGGLKNLLASGFSLPEAIQLMERFKDTAAFNRQAALGFGQAIVGATEGIKNGNSILVDNAGVTKNLSKILEEAGYSAQDLSNATSDANIRQALFNGLIKETNPMVGDAAKLVDTLAGEQARNAAETQNTARKLGQALTPALLTLTRKITPLIRNVGDWIEKNQGLTAGLLITGVTILGSLAGLAAFGAAVSLVSTGVGALAAVVRGLSSALVLLNINPVVLAVTALALVMTGVVTVMGLFSDRSNTASNAIERQRQAQESLTKANQAAKVAQQELSDALLAKEGADLRVEAATQRSKEAIDTYGAESYEARSASYDLKLALDEQAKANERVTEKTTASTAAVKAQKDASATADQANIAAKNSANEAAGGYKNFSDRVNDATDALKKNDMQRYSSATFSVPVTGSSGAGLTVPKKALGTNFAPGGSTLVGEHGPEIVNLPAGSQVAPSWQSRSQGGSDGTVQVTIMGNVINETAEAATAWWDRLNESARLARSGMAG